MQNLIAGVAPYFTVEKRYIRKDGQVVWILLTVGLIRDPKGQSLYFVSQIQDITERKQFEDSRRQTQAALAQAQKLAQLGYYRWSRSKQRLLSCNDEYLRILGIAPASIVGDLTGMEPYLHPEDRRNFIQAHGAAEAEGKACRLEFRIVRPDGAIRHLLDLNEPDPASGTPPDIWSGTVQDITWQKEQVVVLQAYRERLELTLEAANATYWEVDLTNMTYTASAEYSAILGYGADGISREVEAWLGLIHPDDLERARQSYVLPPNDEANHKLEYRIRSKDGSWRWFLSQYRACAFDDLGRPTRLQGVDFDITIQKQQAARLQAYRERLELALEAGGAANWEYDLTTKSYTPSPEYLATLGYGTDVKMQEAEDWLAHVHPDDRERIGQSYALPPHDHASHQFEYRIRSKGGTWRWHLGQFRACAFDDFGRPTRLVGMDFDITQQKQRQAELLEARARVADAANRAKITFWRQKSGSTSHVWSEAAEKILGRSAAQMPDTAEQYLKLIYHEDVDRVAVAYIQNREQGSAYSLEYRILRSDGAVAWLHEIGEVDQRHADGSISFAGSLQDITESKTLEARLELLATVDELTGAHNRRSVLTQAGIELLRARRFNHPLAFLSLDIDHFKQFNDRFGHKIGDLVLSTFSNVCRNALRPSDMLARIGGEEFLVMLPETGLDQAVSAAERLTAHVRQAAFSIDPPIGKVTASVGVTAIRGADDTIEAALERIDRALYRAKELGRDRIEAEV
jgi:diguanylate cyclase (GGDEF)-like protein/PAS domain S-box-containing protein